MYIVWTWSPVIADFGGDNATYFLTANLFSPYSQPFNISEYFATHSQYPPLYPLLLALFGGGDSILIAHIVTTSFLLLAMLIIYKWVLALGYGRMHALVLVVIFSLLPGTYFQVLSIHSEYLYLLLSIAGLYTATLENKRWLWIAAILIASAGLTRSAGISLIFSFIIYLFLNNERNKYTLSVIVIMPMVLWGILNNQNSTSYLTQLSEPYTQDFIISYFHQIGNQCRYLLSAWRTTFTYGESGHLFLTVYAGLCIYVMFYRMYMKKLDGIYAFFYLAMILSWPYPAESIRLLFPVVPVLLVQTGVFVKNFCRTWKPGYNLLIGNIILEGILLIIIIPNFILTVSRFNKPIEEHLTPYKHTYAWYSPNLQDAISRVNYNHTIISSLKDAKKHIPDEECVYSIKPSIIGLYMKRISTIPPEIDSSDDAFNKSLQQSSCRYFYFLANRSPSFNKALYPFERVRKKIDVIKIYYSNGGSKKHLVAILGKLKD